MNDSRFFSLDYFEARARFKVAAQAAGARLDERELEVRGPRGEALSINFAYLGPVGAPKLLLHTSGIHGVEGFAGSAVQLAALEKGVELPHGVGLALIHSLNPFGMAYTRRVNENNVDLNRNFLARDEMFCGADPNYAELSKILNERPWPDWYWPQILLKLSQIGFTALRNAVVCGQYEFPNGLFFGGKKPQASAEIYRQWLKETCGNPHEVVAIDVHTGLGKYGEEILFCHNNGVAPDLGKPFTTLSTAIGYKARGGLETLTSEQFPQAKWAHLTQEFGTYSMPRLLKVLREENLQDREKSDGGRAKSRLVEMMNPTDKAWQAAVVVKGVDTLNRTLQWMVR